MTLSSLPGCTLVGCPPPPLPPNPPPLFPLFPLSPAWGAPGGASWPRAAPPAAPRGAAPPPPFLLTLPSISSFLPYALARVRVT